jgi:hypothetical protein
MDDNKKEMTYQDTGSDPINEHISLVVTYDDELPGTDSMCGQVPVKGKIYSYKLNIEKY